VIHLGPLAIHAYGLMIALGVVAGVWLAGRRLEAAGAGTRDDFTSVAMWAVGGGIIGARLYYIVTDKSQPWKEPSRWIKIWEGGLGIPGGLLLGTVVAIWAAKRRGISVSATFTAAAPALPLSQAIGRWGNWWNQELFGRPTTLPWGLKIDDAHLPQGYAPGTLFHPTFLYESAWNVALCLVLLQVDKRVRLRPGRLLAVYVAGYSIGRFWVEGLRIDPANSGGGWRLNQWTAVVAFVLSAGFLVIDAIRHRDDEPIPVDAVDVDVDAVDVDDADVDDDVVELSEGQQEPEDDVPSV
jgi:prolipoprotein diacylglyceryl transferase